MKLFVDLQPYLSKQECPGTSPTVVDVETFISGADNQAIEDRNFCSDGEKSNFCALLSKRGKMSLLSVFDYYNDFRGS